MAQARIIVISNKWWECDALMAVMLNDNARPAAKLGWPSPLVHPHKRPDQNNLPKYVGSVPRAVFSLVNVDVEVWCVSDLLDSYPDQGKFQSSTERKAERLPSIFLGTKPSLVLSFGTAAMPAAMDANGSVVVGTRVFIHDGHPSSDPNSDSKWKFDKFDTLIPSTLSEVTFSKLVALDPTASPPPTERFIVPPLVPSKNPGFLSDYAYSALGSANVTDYHQYPAIDPQTVAAFAKVGDPATAMSLETTHGLLRAQSDAPFLFVSGIVNRIGKSATELQPRSYAQDTAAAHNAGVILAWMLPQIDTVFATS